MPILRSRLSSSLRAISVTAGLALPGFGPAAATNQSRWLALYAICLVLPFVSRKPTRTDWWAMLFVAYAALSILWSPDQGHGLVNFAHIAAGFILVFVLKGMDVRLGVVIAYTIVLVLDFTDSVGVFGNKNWTAEFLLIAAPLVLWWGWDTNVKGLISMALLLTAVVDLVYFNSSQTEWVVVGVCFWGLFMRKLRFRTALGLTLAVIPTLVLAYGIFALEGNSVWSRFEIWHNTFAGLDPVLGHGLGSFNYVYDTFREAHFVWRDWSIMTKPTQYAGAAHNVVVQILSELGIVGLVLAIMPFLFIRLPPFAAASVVIFGVIAMFGFPEQNPQTVLLLCIALGYRDEMAGNWVAVLVGRAGRRGRVDHGQIIPGNRQSAPGGSATEPGGS